MFHFLYIYSCMFPAEEIHAWLLDSHITLLFHLISWLGTMLESNNNCQMALSLLPLYVSFLFVTIFSYMALGLPSQFIAPLDSCDLKRWRVIKPLNADVAQYQHETVKGWYCKSEPSHIMFLYFDWLLLSLLLKKCAFLGYLPGPASETIYHIIT